jgi:hypothetical protein
VISLPSIQGRIIVLACPRLLRKGFYRPGKEIHDQLSRFPFIRCVNHSSELYNFKISYALANWTSTRSLDFFAASPLPGAKFSDFRHHETASRGNEFPGFLQAYIPRADSAATPGITPD